MIHFAIQYYAVMCGFIYIDIDILLLYLNTNIHTKTSYDAKGISYI